LLGLYLENKPTLPKLEKLETKCQHLSAREQKAQKAERDSIKFMQCIYMNDNIGKVFKGIVSSVTEYGVFIIIPENHCEVLVKLNTINGTWQVDLKNHNITEFNTKEKIVLGDKVHIIINKVDVEKKNIDASIIRL
jgi:ribonuclease R